MNLAVEMEEQMPHRLLSLLAGKLGFLALLAMGAAPAWAHDPYSDHYYRDQHRAYDHYARDRNADYGHHLRDSVGGFGHAVGDLFRYGTTNPYSSPGHYYRDQHRAYDHDRRDRHRDYDHYLRDRHEAYDHYREDSHARYYPY